MMKAGRLLQALVVTLVPAALVAAGTAFSDPRAPGPLLLRASGPAVGALAEAPGGGVLAWGDAAGTLACVDLRTAAPLWQVKKAHAGAISALRYDGATLFSLGGDGVVRAWDAANGKALQASQALSGSAGLWLSPDPRLLYSALPGGGLRALKRQGLGAAKPLTLASTAACAALLPLKEGHFLASQADGWLCYADPVFGVVRKVQLDAPALALAAIKVEAEEKYAVALLADGKAVFVDLKDLSVKKQLTLTEGAPAFAFVSHEAKRALLVGADGHLSGYALPGGGPEADAPGAPAEAAAPVDEGNGVVLAGADGSLRLFRHPGVQAAFVRALDQAETAAQAGQMDRALQGFSAALNLYQDPAVRAELEQAKAAKKAAQQAQRDKMKALMRGAGKP